MTLQFLTFIATVLAVLFGMHLGFYWALIHFFSIVNHTARTALLAALCFLSLSFIASFLFLRLSNSSFGSIFYILSAGWLGLLVNLLLAAAMASLVMTAGKIVGHALPKQAVAAVLFTAAVFYAAYGVWSAFHPRMKHITVEIENLPGQWKGKTLVQLSDVHLGHVHGVDFLRRIVRQVNALHPELVCITGDLFDGLGSGLTPFIEPLKALRAQKGVFYVLGNHDTYVGISAALETLDKTHIRVLRDEAVEIDGLQIVGISYPGIGGDRDVRNLPGFGDDFSETTPKVLLFHTPTSIGLKSGNRLDRHFSTYWVPDTSFALNKEIGIDLQLSGHTHAGQLFPLGYLTKAIYGGYDYGFHKEGRFSIYTTSGVGTWGPPMRTGHRPEIVAVTLK
jgi:predicted MPP superfamily phosphohydrolase